MTSAASNIEDMAAFVLKKTRDIVKAVSTPSIRPEHERLPYLLPMLPVIHLLQIGTLDSHSVNLIRGVPKFRKPTPMARYSRSCAWRKSCEEGAPAAPSNVSARDSTKAFGAQPRRLLIWVEDPSSGEGGAHGAVLGPNTKAVPTRHQHAYERALCGSGEKTPWPVVVSGQDAPCLQQSDSAYSSRPPSQLR